MNGTSRPEPDSPPATLPQPTQAMNPPVPTNNEPPTPPTRHLVIDKRLPRSTPNTDQPRITSFFTRTPQARAPQRPAVPPHHPHFVPAISRKRPTSPARKRKAPLTTHSSTEPRKRTKETHQETLTRRRRRAVQEYAQASNHGGIINLQIMTQPPPRQRPPSRPNGHTRTKLAVGEQVPPKVPTQGVDVDVSQ
jgi:hypothetical protein